MSAADFRSGNVSVVGMLGLPLGTAVEIEARAVPRFSDTSERHLVGFGLEVERVNGRPLAPSPVMEFSIVGGFNNALVATSELALAAMLESLAKNGRVVVEPSELTYGPPWPPDRIEELRRNYAGSRHKLIVYEQGRFGGTPATLPQDCAHQSSATPFGFRTELMILGERD